LDKFAILDSDLVTMLDAYVVYRESFADCNTGSCWNGGSGKMRDFEYAVILWFLNRFYTSLVKKKGKRKMTMFASLTSKMLSVSTSDHASVVSLNLFVALLCACIVIGHLLEENRWMNESITALLIVSFHYFALNGS